MARRPFYGWILVAVAWVIYGFGISPAYYSWGFFAPNVIAELGWTRGQTGLVFGIFTFLYSGVGPLAGAAISRWGCRAVMTAGSALAAIGFAAVSRIDSVGGAIVCYSLLGGVGIGFSTILPSQTLATNWFVRYRARAVAIIFIAGGIVGRGVTRFDRFMVEVYDWRTGWLVIAGISTTLAVIAAVLVRNRPEDLAQEPDGGPPAASAAAGRPRPTDEPHWSAARAMRTPQFALLCLAGVGYAVPWGVVVQHGRLHLQDLGFTTEAAASVLGTMILVSIAGRLSGSLGDFVRPQNLLGAALLLEGAGVLLLLRATTITAAYVGTLAVGIGFGAAYITIAVVFSNFFGRQAFATTAGTRFLITGVFNALAPWLTGVAFDRLGSYRIAFLAVVAVALLGAIAAFAARQPTGETVAVQHA